MEEKVINLIARILGVDSGELDLSTEIGDLPEWDSMHHIAIIKELENLFNIKFEQGDLADCEDISDLVALINDLNADR